MFNKYITIFVFFFLFHFKVKSQINFDIPSSVCADEMISIENVSLAQTYYWSFCSTEASTVIQGAKVNNQGSLNSPVFMKIVKDHSDYFSFIINHNGSLTRNFYGSNLLNTPASVNLGNLGVIGGQAEGIEILNDNGIWYGFITCGGDIDPKFIKLNFGNSLLNIPTGLDLGNIGNLNFPMDLEIYEQGNKFYGFTVNFLSNTITRFDFGNSLNNIPIGVNLGNIGGLSSPVGISMIEENNIWYMFITNERNNNSITRIKFGASLSSVPLGVNLGSLAVLDGPRDISTYKDCGKTYGIVVNRGNNHIVKLDFGLGLENNIKAESLGNLGELSFPHGISEMFRTGGNLYTFITNVNGNRLSLLEFKGCDNSSFPASQSKIPPAFSYNKPGIYSIKLTVDEFLPTYSSVCKSIEVKDCCPAVNLGKDTILCSGQELKINLGNPNYVYAWQDGSNDLEYIITSAGKYWLSATMNGCTVSDTLNVQFKDCSCPIINLGPDKQICRGEEFLIDLGKTDYDFIWQDGSISNPYKIASSGVYWLSTTKNGCQIVDSLNVEVMNCCIPSLIPNIITPNDDNKNDFFEIGCSEPGWRINIVNRWGNVVFTAENYLNNWGGKGCADGVYFYMLDNKNLNRRYSGYIQILR